MNTTQNSRLAALESLSLGAIPALQALIALHSTQKLFALTDRDRCDIRRGTTTALALTTEPMPSNVGGDSLARNAATYRGEQAVGLSFAYRANTENPLAVTGGVSYAGGKSVGESVGVAGEF